MLISYFNLITWFKGYGMVQPCGHVDYYPNAGLNQPGCSANPVTKIMTEGDIFAGM